MTEVALFLALSCSKPVATDQYPQTAPHGPVVVQLRDGGALVIDENDLARWCWCDGQPEGGK